MRFSLSFVALVAMAGPALAQDWTGAYAGGGLTLMSGGVQSFDPETGDDVGDYFDAEGEAVTLFGGYNMELSGVVVGGELAYTIGENFLYGTDSRLEKSGFYFIDDLFDVKARVGYDAGSALIYGVLGYSSGTYHRTASGNSTERETITVDGMAYGIGLDYAVSDVLTVGGELLVRELEGTSGIDDLGFDFDHQTITIRAAYSF